MTDARSAFVTAVAFFAVACGSAAAGEGGASGETRQRILGGYVDDADKAVVGLAIDGTSIGYNFFSGHCSGTLIAPNLVLTARHCVALLTGESAEGGVICGQTRFTTQGPGTMFRATTETVRPSVDGPEFHAGLEIRVASTSNELCGNDVALIILEGAGVPAAEATPIVPRIDLSPEPSEVFSAVGYGVTSVLGGGGGIRMRIDEQFVECANDCTGLLGAAVMATEWIGTAPVCPGDSGGPALDEAGKVVGVVSRGGQGCRSSVYGDVASFRDVIIATALDAARLGGYEPPFWAVTGSSTPPPPPPEPEPEPEPQPDSVGETCAGPCANDLQCLSADGVTGICVPACSEAAPSCPAGYHCDSALGVCSNWPVPPPAASADSANDDGGCTVVAARRGPVKPVPWLVGAALLAGLVVRRRRR